jgi:small subunit ribosomal protein S13
MPRISGIDIPLDKQIRISLRYVYGIGPINALLILREAGIDPMKKARELNEDEISRIVNIIDRTYVVEGALRRQVQQNIQRLKDIQSYRGSRHRRSLPARGQRTRSNARTRKGPRKTVAGKKGVKELHG